jgi:hypothetical protein
MAVRLHRRDTTRPFLARGGSESTHQYGQCISPNRDKSSAAGSTKHPRRRPVPVRPGYLGLGAWQIWPPATPRTPPLSSFRVCRLTAFRFPMRVSSAMEDHVNAVQTGLPARDDEPSYGNSVPESASGRAPRPDSEFVMDDGGEMGGHTLLSGLPAQQGRRSLFRR